MRPPLLQSLPGAPSIGYHLLGPISTWFPLLSVLKHMLLASLATPPWPSQLGAKETHSFSQRLSDCLGLPDRAWAGARCAIKVHTEALLLVGDTLPGDTTQC